MYASTAKSASCITISIAIGSVGLNFWSKSGFSSSSRQSLVSSSINSTSLTWDNTQSGRENRYFFPGTEAALAFSTSETIVSSMTLLCLSNAPSTHRKTVTSLYSRSRTSGLRSWSANCWARTSLPKRGTKPDSLEHCSGLREPQLPHPTTLWPTMEAPLQLMGQGRRFRWRKRRRCLWIVSLAAAMISSRDLRLTLLRSGSTGLLPQARDGVVVLPAAGGAWVRRDLVLHLAVRHERARRDVLAAVRALDQQVVHDVRPGGDRGLVRHGEDGEALLAALAQGLEQAGDAALVLRGHVGELLVQGDERRELETLDEDDAEQEGGHVLHAAAEGVHGVAHGLALADEDAVAVAALGLVLLDDQAVPVVAEHAAQPVGDDVLDLAYAVGGDYLDAAVQRADRLDQLGLLLLDLLDPGCEACDRGGLVGEALVDRGYRRVYPAKP